MRVTIKHEMRKKKNYDANLLDSTFSLGPQKVSTQLKIIPIILSFPLQCFCYVRIILMRLLSAALNHKQCRVPPANRNWLKRDYLVFKASSKQSYVYRKRLHVNMYWKQKVGIPIRRPYLIFLVETCLSYSKNIFDKNAGTHEMCAWCSA